MVTLRTRDHSQPEREETQSRSITMLSLRAPERDMSKISIVPVHTNGQITLEVFFVFFLLNLYSISIKLMTVKDRKKQRVTREITNNTLIKKRP